MNHVDYFPGASKLGNKIFLIDGVPYLIQDCFISSFEDKDEIGWDCLNLNDNFSYHVFFESDLKNKKIQEY